jgi:hypothetical protein
VLFRNLRARATSSREAQTEFERIKRELGREATADADLLQTTSDLVDRLRGRDGTEALPLEAVWAQLTPTAEPSAAPPAPTVAAPSAVPAPHAPGGPTIAAPAR